MNSHGVFFLTANERGVRKYRLKGSPRFVLLSFLLLGRWMGFPEQESQKTTSVLPLCIRASMSSRQKSTREFFMWVLPEERKGYCVRETYAVTIFVMAL